MNVLQDSNAAHVDRRLGGPDVEHVLLGEQRVALLLERAHERLALRIGHRSRGRQLASARPPSRAPVDLPLGVRPARRFASSSASLHWAILYLARVQEDTDID